jgi:hypothetical protein
MTWITAPAGLYTFDERTGKAVPILAINTNGLGLTPGGATTTQIHMIGAPQGNPDTTTRIQTRTNSNDYMAAVREAETNGTQPCHHGEPRGPHYCANCRRTTRHTNARTDQPGIIGP